MNNFYQCPSWTFVQVAHLCKLDICACCTYVQHPKKLALFHIFVFFQFFIKFLGQFIQAYVYSWHDGCIWQDFATYQHVAATFLPLITLRTSYHLMLNVCWNIVLQYIHQPKQNECNMFIEVGISFKTLAISKPWPKPSIAPALLLSPTWLS